MATQSELLSTCNAVRAAAGLLELAEDPGLDGAAMKLAKVIAKTGKVSHAGFNLRLRLAKFEFSAAAENAALAPDVAAAVAMWKASPGHLANLMGDYTHAGCGVAEGKKGTAFVLTVAKAV